MDPILVLYGVILAVTAVAAMIDARTGHIPNWITLPALVIAPLASGILRGPSGLLWAISGALLSGLVPYLLFRRGGMGGGDVKLFAAIGAASALSSGLSLGLEAQLYTFLVAALWAMGKLAWEGKLLVTFGRTVALAVNPFIPTRYRRSCPPELMTSFRLGPAIFVGTALAIASHMGVGPGSAS